MSPQLSAIAPESTTEEGGIVLFDGVCNFCNSSINFVIDRDPKRYYRFAPLQSELGKELLAKYGLPADSLDTIVLIEGGRAHLRSSAALRIARRLKFPWFLAAAALAIPTPLRNWGYGFIAKHRYRWFGKSESCRVPTPDLKARFLE